MIEIKLSHAALDESELRGGSIILRGVLDQSSLKYLRTDDYQREALPLTSLSKMIRAMQAGEVMPDIELGMRGQRFRTKDDVFWLLDLTFVVDGFQRINAALHVLSLNPGAMVHIGATVHFDTTKEWERERFRVLNTQRTPVSPNVLLRNKRDDSPAILTLYGLSKTDKNFTLASKVCWAQRMARGELISAFLLTKCTGMLHSHKGPGRGSNLTEIVSGLDKIAANVGLNVMRENVALFFALVDECWGVRRIQYRETAIHLRGTFLTVLALFLSDHHDFWKGDEEKRLFVDASLRKKLAQFPIGDPEITRLCGAGGKARQSLYFHLRDHINSGKRTKRISSRVPDEDRTVEALAKRHAAEAAAQSPTPPAE